jgi:hypothetical protein
MIVLRAALNQDTNKKTPNQTGDLKEWEDVEISDSDDGGQHKLQDMEDEDFSGI